MMHEQTDDIEILTLKKFAGTLAGKGVPPDVHTTVVVMALDYGDAYAKLLRTGYLHAVIDGILTLQEVN